MCFNKAFGSLPRICYHDRASLCTQHSCQATTQALAHGEAVDPMKELVLGQLYRLPNAVVVMATWDETVKRWLLCNQTGSNVWVVSAKGRVFALLYGLDSIGDIQQALSTGWSLDDLTSARPNVELHFSRRRRRLRSRPSRERQKATRATGELSPGGSVLVPAGAPASPAPAKRKTSAIAGLALLFFCVLGWLLIDSLSNHPTPSKPDTPRQTGGVAGEEARLYSTALDSISVCVDEEAFDRYVEVLLARDEYGLYELVVTGRIFFVVNDTKVLVLRTRDSPRSTKVRVLGGEHAGRAGWVQSDWVK